MISVFKFGLKASLSVVMLSSMVSYAGNVVVMKINGLTKSKPAVVVDSCQAVKANNSEATDGSYEITVDGVKRTVECNMTLGGGGWMKLADSVSYTINTGTNQIQAYTDFSIEDWERNTGFTQYMLVDRGGSYSNGDFRGTTFTTYGVSGEIYIALGGNSYISLADSSVVDLENSVLAQGVMCNVGSSQSNFCFTSLVTKPGFDFTRLVHRETYNYYASGNLWMSYNDINWQFDVYVR